MQDVSTDGRLVLDGDLTVRNAAAICATLRDKVAQPADVLIDCSAVTEVDLSFVQLLVAARATASVAGRTVALMTRPGAGLLDTLTRGGFRVTDNGSADAPVFWFEGADATRFEGADATGFEGAAA